MPFKSQAQRRKLAQLLVEGKISNETFEEWNRDTGAKRLPFVQKEIRQEIERKGKPDPHNISLAEAVNGTRWREMLSLCGPRGAGSGINADCVQVRHEAL